MSTGNHESSLATSQDTGVSSAWTKAMRLLSHAHKQRICAAFASVIKNSAAADHIRPEKFFASMSQGIESLLNEDILDLSPLYASFGGRNPPSVVTGAFMAFEAAGKDLGLRVRLPDAIQHLPTQIKNQSAKAFDESVVRKKNNRDRPPSHIDWLKQPDTPAPIVNYRQKIELGDRQFKAVSVSDATRIAIADAATWAIKDTEGGAKPRRPACRQSRDEMPFGRTRAVLLARAEEQQLHQRCHHTSVLPTGRGQLAGCCH